MKFTVELDDFYLDEDEDLIPAIKAEVIGSVSNQIWNKIRDKVEKSVVDPLVTKIRGDIDKKINDMMMDKLTNIMKSESFKPNEYSKEMTFQEYLEKKMNDSGYSTLQSTIKNLAKEQTDELKKRYDLLFATQIVSRLSDNGMLKDDVAELLLTEK